MLHRLKEHCVFHDILPLLHEYSAGSVEAKRRKNFR